MTLVLQQLSYAINGNHLVEEISLALELGKLYGLIAPNGSGKTTLLKLLAGVLKATSGTFFWDTTLLKMPLSHQLASFVPQKINPLFDFLVKDFVAIGRYPYCKHYWKESESKIVHHALESTRTLFLKDRSILQISQGELQRVYIARALASQTPIMLLDEPTSHLDIVHQMEIWALLKNLSREGKLILIATHEIASAKEYCDEVILLKQGRSIHKGPFNGETLFWLQKIFNIDKNIFNQLQEHLNV